MSDHRFLLIRLGSLGDIIHALPAAAALRDAFPESRVDWAIDRKWARPLEGNPDITETILVERRTAAEVIRSVRKLHAARYTCAIDFQSLYKSALMAFASGAPRRIGFQRSYAREGLAALFYTERLNPRGAHKIDHNLTLVEHVGARKSRVRFPLMIRAEEEARVERELANHDLGEFFVLNPGAGWKSKCWPPERYGELYGKLTERYGWRGVISFGPGEENLAQQVVRAAGNPPPLAINLELGPLMALLRRSKFVVSADTGPLHLASALGTPVVGLFGPTDPARNGPYGSTDVTVRNPRFSETTYRRGSEYSQSMLSITVEQVVEAVTQRLGASA
jgi:lipopolysaccharide heptosyltransferase I